MLREFLTLAVVLLAGVLAGLASVRLAADNPTLAGAVQLGPWRSWPDAGRPDALPHARLRYHLDGALPPPPTDRLEMVADEDDAGHPLRADCIYRLRGAMPAARFWLLALHSRSDGAPPRAFASLGAEDVMYEPDGKLVIGLSTRPLAGNWLRAPRKGRVRLVLHLLGLSPLERERLLKRQPFAIERRECR